MEEEYTPCIAASPKAPHEEGQMPSRQNKRYCESPEVGQGIPFLLVDVINHTLPTSTGKLNKIQNYTNQDMHSSRGEGRDR